MPPVTPVGAGANVAASANNQTLSGAASKTTYIKGWYVTGLGATAGSTLKITVTGLALGTLTYDYVVPAGVTTAAPTLQQTYDPPLPASGQNTSIVVNIGSFGSGNTSASAGAWGFQI